MDLGDNLVKNGTRAMPKMMVDEKADCVIFFMPVSEYRADRETVTTARDGSTSQQVDVQYPNAIAQSESLIGFLA